MKSQIIKHSMVEQKLHLLVVSGFWNGNTWITVATGSGTINSIKIRLTRGSSIGDMVMWVGMLLKLMELFLSMIIMENQSPADQQQQPIQSICR